MDSYLYKIFTGMLNPSESIKADSEEFRIALSRLLEAQKKLKETMSEEQLALLEEVQAHKNHTLSLEMFEAFRAGVKLVLGICDEVRRD